jgi:hypothetical protein
MLAKIWANCQVRIREEDHYVCLTDMAKATGKRFNNWNQLMSTHSYLEVLSSVTRIPVTELIQVQQGGVPEAQGTWGHPKVALRFAQWCSDEFAVQVDFWIDELLTTGSVSRTSSKSKLELIAEALLQIDKVEKEQALMKQQMALEAQRIDNIQELVEQHDNELDRIFKPDGDYYTVRGYANKMGIKHLTISEANRLGRKASKYCKQEGIPTDKMDDPRYGYVNCYPERVLSMIFE